MRNDHSALPSYMTVQEAAVALGEGGAQRLFDAHVAGKVTLVGWRRSSSTHGPLPIELFANAVEIEPGTNSIVPSGTVADFGEFERNYRHLDRWDDVKVKRADLEALKNVQESTSPGTSQLAQESVSPGTSQLAQAEEDAAARLTARERIKTAARHERIKTAARHERIKAAARQLASEGQIPGEGGTTAWKVYYSLVWGHCGVLEDARGYGYKTIQRCVGDLKERGGLTDKQG